MSKSAFTSMVAALMLAGACGTAPSRDTAESASDATPGIHDIAALAHIPDDTTCSFDTVAFHADARRLLDDFLTRDFNGAFLRSNSWHAMAWMCPAHVPGWDGATLISEYRAIPLEIADSIARFEVQFEVIGLLGSDTGGGTFSEQPRVEVDTFKLLKSVHGWRIASPVQSPHVGPKAALSLEHLKAEARSRIRGYVR